jgi:cobalamin biosynthesis Mg chelatase CobN
MADDKPGRFTPKGGAKGAADAAKSAGKSAGKAAAGAAGAAAKSAGDAASSARPSTGRYTPRQEKAAAVAMAETKPWVPYVMFALLIVGLLAIILNYVDLLPSSPSNWYLLGGLVSITLGFMTATQLK